MQRVNDIDFRLDLGILLFCFLLEMTSYHLIPSVRNPVGSTEVILAVPGYVGSDPPQRRQERGKGLWRQSRPKAGIAPDAFETLPAEPVSMTMQRFPKAAATSERRR